MKVKHLIVCLVVLAIPATAQVRLETSRAHYVNPADGQQLYAAYCAACHGSDLKGNAALKPSVPHNIDLTQIARRYPQDLDFRVRYQIEHGTAAGGHPAPMPAWATILRYNGEPMARSIAIRNLTSFVVSKQD